MSADYIINGEYQGIVTVYAIRCLNEEGEFIQDIPLSKSTCPNYEFYDEETINNKLSEEAKKWSLIKSEDKTTTISDSIIINLKDDLKEVKV